MVALAGLALSVGLPAAAQGAEQRGRASAHLYKLSVDFTGKYNSARFSGSGTNTIQIQDMERVTTYRAKSVRAFYIRVGYRGTCRRLGCLTFRTKLAGSLTHWGSMWERQYRGPLPVAGTPMQTYVPKPEDFCTQNLTEQGTGDVAGRAQAFTPPSVFGVTLAVEPDIDFQGQGSYDDGCGQPVQFLISPANLVMAPSDIATDAVNLRRKLGREFTISYEPGALDEKPNRVTPTLRETYDFSWTLRFTPVRKRR